MIHQVKLPVLRAVDIEIEMSRFFDFRRHLIVPNVSWGLFRSHEADLIIVSKSMYAREIEIKVSKSDMRKELRKKGTHWEGCVRQCFFAIPSTLEDCIDLIDNRYGVYVLTPRFLRGRSLKCSMSIKLVRPAKINKDAKKLTRNEFCKLSHLAAMRIWGLKQKLQKERQLRETKS